MSEQRQTTICAGDIVADADGVQWRVCRVLRSVGGWMVSLELERTADGVTTLLTAHPSDVTLVGVQLTLGGEAP